MEFDIRKFDQYSQGWKEPEVKEQYNPDRTILTLAFTKKQAE